MTATQSDNGALGKIPTHGKQSVTHQPTASNGEEHPDEFKALRARIQILNDQRQAEREFFITETELLRRLPVSRRTLFGWRTSGKIPFVRVSGRRIIFHWPSVEAALLRQQKEATI